MFIRDVKDASTQTDSSLLDACDTIQSKLANISARSTQEGSDVQMLVTELFTIFQKTRMENIDKVTVELKQCAVIAAKCFFLLPQEESNQDSFGKISYIPKFLGTTISPSL